MESILKDSHQFAKESLPKIMNDQQKAGLKIEWVLGLEEAEMAVMSGAD